MTLVRLAALASGTTRTRAAKCGMSRDVARMAGGRLLMLRPATGSSVEACNPQLEPIAISRPRGLLLGAPALTETGLAPTGEEERESDDRLSASSRCNIDQEYRIDEL